MIWEVMSGNGLRIGIIVIRLGVFCGAVLGTTLQATCVQLTATVTTPRIPTTTSVSVVYQDQNNNHFPVHSTIFTALPFVGIGSSLSHRLGSG